MGYTPQQVDQMSLWQFMAAWEGYLAAHDPDADKKLSEDQAEDIWQWMQGKG